MIMQKVMEKRRSVREYKNKDLEANDLETLRGLISKLPQVASGAEVRFSLIKEGKQVFKALTGIAGYNGVMIEAPHYLIILGSQHQDIYKAAGYVTEWLVLKLTQLEIGSCWIDTNKNEERIKSVLGIETTDEVVGILAIGYGAMDTRLSNIYDTMKTGSVSSLTSIGYPHVDIGFTHEPVSGRMSIKDLVYLNQWNNTLEVEELERRGLADAFYYMRLAPSWGNQQPWRFILDQGRIVLVIKKEYGADDSRVSEIDAGIAMLYFQTAMHSDGLPGTWHFIAGFDEVAFPEDYMLAGIYTY